ncbi:MAG: 4-diphosphocytidyl-2C-methyl-D-erythritol kinase [Ignavibacterium sp.]|uniref:PD-(D/E)XK nuclease superfamily protein n=1 Tax=Ignavibacterium sp. TaxID=2651167 RepID=UPI0021DBCC8E|nr:PD-(D/E)XK nuclease superfamily protein [Ignavibacterium sp.]BDQ02739.1 MAG: 4-diphosphocytidyl-2C-methyl-D-erythritol kinase [Ignavibacterium sp.]GIV46205.1 MAG: 4-diphosphocytidyl-2C-methyl-D-erythritol kinase [Ignavibacterium sp.]
MGKGQKGNITGNQLEAAVKTVLSGKGFKIVKYRDWIKTPHKFGDELLLTNVPYTTIYKHKGNTEFLLISKKYNCTIRIECKWQQTSGSVDEKLPYLYLNVIEAMPEDKILILIDGRGWKEGAIKWLKESVEKKRYTNQNSEQKDILVFNLTDFFTWANKTFI